MKKPYFPLFVDISKKKIIVVGGGSIATRRVQTLLAFAQDILVVSPEVTDKIRTWHENGKVRWLRARYCSDVLEGAQIVIAATDDTACNEQVVRDCRQQEILVNVSHRKELCDFYFPAIASGDTVVAGITTSGRNHRQARMAREAIEYTIERLEREEADE